MFLVFPRRQNPPMVDQSQELPQAMLREIWASQGKLHFSLPSMETVRYLDVMLISE